MRDKFVDWILIISAIVAVAIIASAIVKTGKSNIANGAEEQIKQSDVTIQSATPVNIEYQARGGTIQVGFDIIRFNVDGRDCIVIIGSEGVDGLACSF